MDFNTITLNDILSYLSVPTYYATGLGLSVLFIKFVGKRLFKSLVEDIIRNFYAESLEKTINTSVDDNIRSTTEKSEEKLKLSLEDKMIEIINNHSIKCKNINLEINDQRYLLRQEFKMFLDSQTRTNEKLDMSVSEIRSICNQILLKLTD